MERRRGEGERKINSFFLSKLPKVSTFFTVTPSGGSRQQTELDAAVSSSSAVSVSRGGDVESEARDAFHEDVSIKSVEMVNYIKC